MNHLFQWKWQKKYNYSNDNDDEIIRNNYLFTSCKTRPEEIYPKKFFGVNHFSTGKISLVFKVHAACV